MTPKGQLVGDRQGLLVWLAAKHHIGAVDIPVSTTGV
jgi:hypothetical protein